MPVRSPLTSTSYGSSIAIIVLSYRNPALRRMPIVCRLRTDDGPRAPTGFWPAFANRSTARVSSRSSSAALSRARGFSSLQPSVPISICRRLTSSGSICGSTIAAVAETKKVAGTFWRSKTASTRGRPDTAPNSPPVSWTTAVSPRARLFAVLFNEKVKATATRAPLGQAFGVSFRPADTAPANCFNCASDHLRPGCASPGARGGGCCADAAAIHTLASAAPIDILCLIAVSSWRQRVSLQRRLVFHVLRDVFGRGEPDAGLRLHVEDQLFEILHARPLPRDVRVHGQHEERALAVGHVEVVLERLHDQPRRRQRCRRRQERRVVENPVHRELDDPRRLPVDQHVMGLVHRLEAAVVEQPGSLEQTHRVHAHRPGRVAIASRPLAAYFLELSDRLRDEPPLLFRLVERHRILVNPSVQGDFVAAALLDRLHHRGAHECRARGKQGGRRPAGA